MWAIAAVIALVGASLANAQPNKEAYEFQVRCGNAVTTREGA